MTEGVLQAEAVTKRFGSVVALDGVSLSVGSGECVALVGESGSGKTTLLRCFNRMTDPDEGEVLVGGEDTREMDPVALRRRVGYVPQDGGLFPHWTVLRNAALVPWLGGREDADARAAEALGRVGLPPECFGERRPSELSGGQRQRVAIARALASAPGLVLLDEPFGALDAITRAEVQEVFLHLQRDTRFAALLVTHDLREALRLGDRVAVMRAGRIEQIAAPDALLGAPATPYVRELLRRAEVSA